MIFFILVLSMTVLFFHRSSVLFSIQGKYYRVPLPRFSFKQRNNKNAVWVFLPRYLSAYYQGELPQAGWNEVEQMGSLHRFSKDNVQIDILETYRSKFVAELDLIQQGGEPEAHH
jgi:hypothetical protein